MAVPLFDAVSEQAVFDRYQREQAARERYRQQATPEVASRAGQIYRSAPWLTPGQVLALAKGNASPQAVELAARIQGENLPAQLDPDNDAPKSWYERNVYDRLKAASRWTFATLDVGPDLVQNVAAQVWSPNDPAGFDGWFASTKLGTMLSSAQGAVDPVTGQPISAGEGFFIGETAVAEQERRSAAVRGTINDAGWTIGRGAANMVFRPGTKPYSIASGLLDAVVLIGADPTVVGGKVTAPIKGARAAVQGVRTVEEANAIRKVIGKAAGELSTSEQALVDGSKFFRFWTEDRRAQRLVNLLADEKNDDPVQILRDTFKGKVDLVTARRFAEAKSTDDVLDVLLDVTNRLDEGNPNLLPSDIRQIPGATMGNWVAERVPLWNSFRHSRLLTQMPEQVVTHGTDVDRTKAVVNYANYLDSITSGYTRTEEGKAVMRKIFDAYADGTKAGMDAADEAFDDAVEKAVANVYAEKRIKQAYETVDRTLPEDVQWRIVKTEAAKEFEEIERVLKLVRKGIADIKNETRAYFVDKFGELTDEGVVQDLFELMPDLKNQFPDLSPEQLATLRLNGPTSLIELMDRVRILPDVRAMRRLTSNPFMRKLLARGDSADPRAVQSIVEYLQNEIWKPITLMTGGYIVRNMLDAQVRIATTGAAGAFNHPWQWIQWNMYRRGAGTITGKSFKDMFDKAVSEARQLDKPVDPFVDAITFSLRRNLEDPAEAMIRGVRNGDYTVTSRAQNRSQWFSGLVEELGQISKDVLFNAAAKGIPAEDLIEYLRTTPKGKKALEEFVRYVRGGVKVVDDTGRPQGLLKVDDVTDEVLATWLNKLVYPRVKLKTAGNDEIAFTVGHRRVPIGPIDELSVADITSRMEILPDGPKKFGPGTKFRNADGDEFIVLNIEDGGQRIGSRFLTDEDAPVRVRFRKVSKNDIIDTEAGKREFREYMDLRVLGIESDPQAAELLPKFTKLATRVTPKTGDNAFARAKDRMTDWFFTGVYGKASQKFERSPVFRQFYYEDVIDNLDLLSRAEAEKLKDTIAATAADFKVSPQDYVGGRANWRKILKAAQEAAGDGTAEQLDRYAQLMALNKTKETLYNATSRNNLEDVMRILVPFGVAHREVLGTYMRFIAEDPTRIRRAQLVYQGFTDFDPDGDGQGFFYQDPTTGEMTFNFPMSGELSKLLTGVESPLAAPVKRVSLGLQVIPGIGPVGQIAASQLIPDTPEFDGVVSLLLPFGRDSFNVAPAWMRKMKDALDADPGRLESVYANTYVDTMRALAASGDYDLSDPQQRSNLFADARNKARILTGLRALAQFTGPAAPANEFIISNKNQDAYASAMVQEFYRLQNENYDTAVQRFIETFGEDAFIYLSSKSKAEAGGLEATTVFGDWERRNDGLLREYPDVAGFFAPGGDDFSFETWSRQLRAGRRRKLSDAEIIEQAQYRMGSSIFRSYRNQVGAYPSEEQRAWLGGVRREIHKRYPGFPAVAVFEVGKFDKQLADLRELTADPRLADNAVAGSIRTYLQYRDEAVASYIASGGAEGGFDTAKRAEPLRDWLASIGATIMRQNPDFGRVWERVLSAEVER